MHVRKMVDDKEYHNATMLINPHGWIASSSPMPAACARAQLEKFIVLHWDLLDCNFLQYFELYWIILYCIAVHNTALYCSTINELD